ARTTRAASKRTTDTACDRISSNRNDATGAAGAERGPRGDAAASAAKIEVRERIGHVFETRRASACCARAAGADDCGVRLTRNERDEFAGDVGRAASAARARARRGIVRRTAAAPAASNTTYAYRDACSCRHRVGSWYREHHHRRRGQIL